MVGRKSVERIVRWESVETGDEVSVTTVDRGVRLTKRGIVGEKGVTTGGLRYWKTSQGGVLAVQPEKCSEIVMHRAAPVPAEPLF